MKTDIAYIYALIDPRDDKVRYIGKTVSPKNRIISHIQESKTYNHYRAKWIRSLTELRLKPIMKVLKVCDLSEFEIYEASYIKFYQSEWLTNSDETGSGNTNRKREIIDEASKKISKIVYQFNLDGEYIKEFKSTREAARQTNNTHANISRCCNGIFDHTGSYIYKYNRDCDIKPVSNPNAVKKSVIEINKNGDTLKEWNSLMDCSRETGLNNGNLSRVCSGINKSLKKRFFKFK